MPEKPFITIFYNDTESRVSKIMGRVVSSDALAYTIKAGNKIITIPLGKIVRIESEE